MFSMMQIIGQVYTLYLHMLFMSKLSLVSRHFPVIHIQINARKSEKARGGGGIGAGLGKNLRKLHAIPLSHPLDIHLTIYC